MAATSHNKRIEASGAPKHAASADVVRVTRPSRIYVRTLRGKSLAVDIASDAHVATLLKEVAARECMNPADLRLMMNGREMKGSEPLRAFGGDGGKLALDGATVHLALRMKRGCIVTLAVFRPDDCDDLPTIQVSVDLDDLAGGVATIKDVKNAVEGVTGLDAEIQTISRVDGFDLRDSTVLTDDHLKGMRLSVPDIEVHHATDNRVLMRRNLWEFHDATVDDLLTAVRKIVPGDNHLRLLQDGIELTDRVRVASIAGKSDTKPGKDIRLTAEFSPPDGTILAVQCTPPEPGKENSMPFPRTTFEHSRLMTVGSLKLMIANVANIPQSKLAVCWNNNGTRSWATSRLNHCRDNMRLSAYASQAGFKGVFYMYAEWWHINVRYRGREHSIPMKSFDENLDAFKNALRKAVPQFDPRLHLLLFADRVLKGNGTLTSYGIVDNSAVEIAANAFYLEQLLEERDSLQRRLTLKDTELETAEENLAEVGAQRDAALVRRDEAERLVRRERGTCVVCMDVDRARDVMVVPCGHECMCGFCAEVINADPDLRARVCPLCRVPIRGLIRVFA